MCEKAVCVVWEGCLDGVVRLSGGCGEGCLEGLGRLSGVC